LPIALVSVISVTLSELRSPEAERAEAGIARAGQRTESRWSNWTSPARTGSLTSVLALRAKRTPEIGHARTGSSRGTPISFVYACYVNFVLAIFRAGPQTRDSSVSDGIHNSSSLCRSLPVRFGIASQWRHGQLALSYFAPPGTRMCPNREQRSCTNRTRSAVRCFSGSRFSR
jgi:hypothetical protein